MEEHLSVSPPKDAQWAAARRPGVWKSPVPLDSSLHEAVRYQSKLASQRPVQQIYSRVFPNVRRKSDNLGATEPLDGIGLTTDELRLIQLARQAVTEVDVVDESPWSPDTPLSMSFSSVDSEWKTSSLISERVRKSLEKVRHTVEQSRAIRAEVERKTGLWDDLHPGAPYSHPGAPPGVRQRAGAVMIAASAHAAIQESHRFVEKALQDDDVDSVEYLVTRKEPVREPQRGLRWQNAIHAAEEAEAALARVDAHLLGQSFETPVEKEEEPPSRSLVDKLLRRKNRSPTTSRFVAPLPSTLPSRNHSNPQQHQRAQQVMVEAYKAVAAATEQEKEQASVSPPPLHRF